MRRRAWICFSCFGLEEHDCKRVVKACLVRKFCWFVEENLRVEGNRRRGRANKNLVGIIFESMTIWHYVLNRFA